MEPSELLPELEQGTATILKLLGHDTKGNGLYETPARVAKYQLEHLCAHADAIRQAEKALKEFESTGENVWVAIQSGFTSTCEHHLLPFFGTAQVIYLPDRKITGLSKVYRALEALCRTPQIQERISTDLASVIMTLDPIGVMVDLQATHTCMRCRGIQDPLSRARTRVFRGAFETDANMRSLALSMLM